MKAAVAVSILTMITGILAVGLETAHSAEAENQTGQQTEKGAAGYRSGLRTFTDRARDYVATVNGGDANAVQRFRENDMSDAFNKTVPAAAFLQFFRNQHRVTGGLELIDVEAHARSSTVADAIVRDRIYGQLHGVVLTLDGSPDGRLSYSEPSDATPAWAIPHHGAPLPAQVAQRARQMVHRGCLAGVFSGAVLVARDNQILMQEACGESNLRYHSMNDVNTRFNIGSINKMFTAVSIMQLVDAGKLSLSDKLSKYADDTWLPRDISSEITIAELLSHTSGLGSFFDDGFDSSSRELYRELDDYKALIHKETLAFTPGSKYQYSDTGMFMLGVVIEKVSGESYFDYVRKHIYIPAGMTSTDCYPMDEPVENLAMGYGYYSKGPFHWRENTFSHVFRGGPAGGGFSTVGDLMRFAGALQGGKLVSSASLKTLWTDHPPNNYGAGFEVSDTVAGKMVGHSGFFMGVSSRLSIFLDANYVVVVLANIDNGAPALMDAIGDQIALAP